MRLTKRIAFVVRQYRSLIPAIWHSYRSPAYPPPTREEVLEFMASGFGGKPVPLEPTCHKGPGYPKEVWSTATITLKPKTEGGQENGN